MRSSFSKALVEELINDILNKKSPKTLENTKIIVKTEEKAGSLKQIKVLKQRQNNICGYHALYNLLTFLSRNNHHFLLEKSEFWNFYHKIKEILLVKAKAKYYGYPWNEDTVCNDILERDFVKYLLKDILKSKDITDLPEMARGSIKNGIMTLEKIKEVQAVFDKFQNEKQYQHGFLIGVGNHWIALVIQKNESLTSYYMDSRELPVLGKSKEFLLDYVYKRFEKNEKRNITKKSEEEKKYFIEMFYSSLLDTQFSLNLIHSCALGEMNFLHECSRIIIIGQIQSFFEHTSNEDDIEKYFEEYVPPNLMIKDIKKAIEMVGENNLKKDVILEIKKFIEYSKTIKKNSKIIQDFKIRIKTLLIKNS